MPEDYSRKGNTQVAILLATHVPEIILMTFYEASVIVNNDTNHTFLFIPHLTTIVKT